MAIMKPFSSNIFKTTYIKKSFEILKNLDDSNIVVYKPTTGLSKDKNSDFLILNENYGSISVFIKYVDLNKIKYSNVNTVTKIDDTRVTNFQKKSIATDYST